METGTKSEVSTNLGEVVPNNWPFPTYKGKPVVIADDKFVDNRKQHHRGIFLNEQPEASF
jgi:hypothetical protein